MSEQGKHTPGPWWIADRTTAEGLSIVQAGNAAYPITGVGSCDLEAVAHCHAHNARLIAAAPETAAERDRLRELCGELARRLLAYVKFEEHAAPASSSPMREKACAALARAKAEGVGHG